MGVELEKVNNFFGCVAGAGSDFFSMYRKHRTHELERLRQMDFDWEAKQEEEEYQARREALADADEAATSAKRAKRQRRKENKKEADKLRKEGKGMNSFSGDG